jgi:hypothetical protein
MVNRFSCLNFSDRRNQEKKRCGRGCADLRTQGGIAAIGQATFFMDMILQ